MLKNVLPARYCHSLDFLNLDKLYEIRLRVNSPTTINYGGRFFLGENGLAETEQEAIISNERELNDIVFKACECSVYAHNEELKQGFITLNNGARIGICGEIVSDNNVVKTIKNFTSLNIRIPHIVKNCSLNALPFLHNENGVFNILIISPPASGKTTFLRDFASQISDKFIARNVLVVDERNEITACNGAKPTLYVGKFTDIFSGCTKQFGITNGIRTMSPEVVLLDEIAEKCDIEALLNVVGAGVKFVASTHSKDLEDLKNKPLFKEFLKLKVIERFVVLSNRKGAGTLEYIFAQDFTCLYCGG
ncbi:MAG: stage III sporulation protein AA [Clostridia bacterium]|nr:stage III sporulation protein AA [Clostridia bacterium]